MPLSKLLAASPGDAQLVEELYLTALARFPSDREREFTLDYLRESEDRPTGAEDVMWSLITSQEFLFNH